MGLESESESVYESVSSNVNESLVEVGVGGREMEDLTSRTRNGNQQHRHALWRMRPLGGTSKTKPPCQFLYDFPTTRSSSNVMYNRVKPWKLRDVIRCNVQQGQTMETVRDVTRCDVQQGRPWKPCVTSDDVMYNRVNHGNRA